MTLTIIIPNKKKSVHLFLSLLNEECLRDNVMMNRTHYASWNLKPTGKRLGRAMHRAEAPRHQVAGPPQDAAAAKRHGLLGTVRTTHIHCRYVRKVRIFYKTRSVLLRSCLRILKVVQ